MDTSDDQTGLRLFKALTSKLDETHTLVLALGEADRGGILREASERIARLTLEPATLLVVHRLFMAAVNAQAALFALNRLNPASRLALLAGDTSDLASDTLTLALNRLEMGKDLAGLVATDALMLALQGKNL